MPSEDLTEALTVLTRYIYSMDPRDASQPIRPAQTSSYAWLPPIPQPPTAPALVRPLLVYLCPLQPQISLLETGLGGAAAFASHKRYVNNGVLGVDLACGFQFSSMD